MIKTTTRVTINSRSRVTLIGTLGLTSFTSSSRHRMDVDSDSDSNGDSNSNNNSNNNNNNNSNNVVGNTPNVNNGDQALLRQLGVIHRWLIIKDQRLSAWEYDLVENRANAVEELDDMVESLPKSLTSTFKLMLLENYYDKVSRMGGQRINSYNEFQGQESVTRASLIGAMQWSSTNRFTAKADVLLNDKSVTDTDKARLTFAKEKVDWEKHWYIQLNIEKVAQKRRWLALHNQLDRMNVNDNSSSGSGARPDPNNSRG